MPKLPVVSGAEAIRTLERLGFVVARQKGGHIVLRRGASGCVVPNHHELKVGTMSERYSETSRRVRRRVYRGAASLTPAHFLDFLRELKM